MGYGADEIYTRMAMRSLELWRESFPTFFIPTGVLWAAREDHPYSVATRDTLTRAGVKHEILAADEMATRFPQMRWSEPQTFGMLEPESGALLARRAVAAVVEDAVRRGVAFEARQVSEPPDAGTVIYSCGPWLPKIFPEVLADRIFPTRQEVFFF